MSGIVDIHGRPLRATDAAPSVHLGMRRPRVRNALVGTGTRLDKDVTTEFIAQALAREAAERMYQMS